MNKTVEKISDTQMMRCVLPVILKEKFPKGATFEELWDELFKDKKLAKVMINSKKEKRLGLLQGLSNRIKDGKEENLMIIKKEDGKNYFMYFDDSLEKQIKLTENYLSSVKNINFDKDTKFEKVKEDLLKEQKTLIKKLEEVNQKLQLSDVDKKSD
ncbi:MULTISPECIES: hypothetical protein [Vagococcus]|uniref:Uncharacterized protein n=1 Tax=Vagococcus fluvialis bH819 TaxID=1255619 RepID=A0A1X6WQ34_9ENTE|nr:MULTISPECIES: hypothetical protein [Vagococcus]SLM86352.1 hypothetical protein FM121_09695 [Vagococcus fluvialis bH819]HCM89007.1 hypothetical protein [Vagococcus sp.]